MTETSPASAESPGGALSAGRQAITFGLTTAVARVSGLLRTVVMVAALGVGSLANAYATANAVPNMLFELFIGGGMRSVLVPTIVSELESGRDAAWRTISAILNIALLLVVPVVIIVAIFADEIFDLLTFGASGAHVAQMRASGAVLLALMIPQVVFYAVDLVITSTLHAHRRFGLANVAVVAGNAVIIALLLVFLATERGREGAPTILGYALLGGGATAGVACIAAVEALGLRGLGARYVMAVGRGSAAIRRAARASGWMLIYVASNQIGLVVVLILANRIAGGAAAYQVAFAFVMLPFGVVGLALISTFLPRASLYAERREERKVGELLSQTLSLAIAMLVPCSLVLVFAGDIIADALFSFGAARGAGASLVGDVLAAFGYTVVPFVVFQLLARARYAFHDTRTPALINLVGVVVNILVDVTLFSAMSGSGDRRIVALAYGHAIAYVTAAGLMWVFCRRRIPGIHVRLSPRDLTAAARQLTSSRR